MDERVSQTERREMRPGRETLAGLLRKPLVQLLLVGTAVTQVVSVRAGLAGNADSKAAGVVHQEEVETIALEPAVVIPDSGVQKAWLEKAVLREAERLGAEYRTKGYSVTPQLAVQIGKAAAEFSIDPEIAFGLVRAESSFRNSAKSPVGAVGLTQLMPRTASWIQPGVTRSQLSDPETNLRIGFKYLRYLMDKYEGDAQLALLAYNRGPGTVDKALKRGRSPDNGYADFVRGKENHGHRLFTR